MNKVDINIQDIDLPPWAGKARNYALKVLKELKKDKWELSILFCGNKTMTELNLKYRNKAGPTDILSFNLGETVQDGKKQKYLPGDIVISLDMLKENAINFKITRDEELRRLIIHGILHLDGMNHKTNNAKESMLCLQEKLLVRLKDERIIGGKK